MWSYWRHIICCGQCVLTDLVVAFRCVLVYLPLQKNMINRFSGNICFGWVFGWLGGLVGLEMTTIRTAQLFYIIAQMYSKCITLAICLTLHFICYNHLNFLNEVHCLLHLDSVQIPSLDLSHLVFLYVLNYVALLKQCYCKNNNVQPHFALFCIFYFITIMLIIAIIIWMTGK